MSEYIPACDETDQILSLLRKSGIIPDKTLSKKIDRIIKGIEDKNYRIYAEIAT